MIHCCTFLVTHVMQIKIMYDVMLDGNIRGTVFDLDKG